MSVRDGVVEEAIHGLNTRPELGSIWDDLIHRRTAFAPARLNPERPC